MTNGTTQKNERVRNEAKVETRAEQRVSFSTAHHHPDEFCRDKRRGSTKDQASGLQLHVKWQKSHQDPTVLTGANNVGGRVLKEFHEPVPSASTLSSITLEIENSTHDSSQLSSLPLLTGSLWLCCVFKYNCKYLLRSSPKAAQRAGTFSFCSYSLKFGKVFSSVYRSIQLTNDRISAILLSQVVSQEKKYIYTHCVSIGQPTHGLLTSYFLF